MKATTKKAKAEKLASDIKFVKDLALNYGHKITDKEAIKALKYCHDDYYELKEYFIG